MHSGSCLLKIASVQFSTSAMTLNMERGNGIILSDNQPDRWMFCLEHEIRLN